jgi:hypothetical protein
VLHPYRRSAVDLLEDAARASAHAEQQVQAAIQATAAAREARITQNKGQLDFNFAA